MQFIRTHLRSFADNLLPWGLTKASPDTRRHRWPLALSVCLMALTLTAPLSAQAESTAPAATIRLAVLKYGTANWLLDVIQRHRLDQAEGVTLAIKEYAGTQATLVALQAGDTDLAIDDWIWVARQRTAGRPFTFVPYSTATGALVVPQGSGIHGIADLKGRSFGIAGGPLDKNWLLLRALAAKQGVDLAGAVEPVYGAPPLISEQLKQGRIEAAITYWHYAARLTAAGYTPVVQIQSVIKDLGVTAAVPMVGFCFDETWATSHRQSLLGFFRAVDQARTLLRDSDAEWAALRPLMAAPDEATFIALRDGFRAGIPSQWGPAERTGAEQVFQILREVGGSQLVGDAMTLPAGTFWDGRSD
ncbi:ABC transporter substrate-binding protein [uncultured Lamprocystis sp.]|jgi:NitT/TauT family transport system substrate-binding protein|uniref:ABC transporter substrate-binding protein n=1 Tax=uncultured Lamprocystis sp. TaxID=543132 RepID=UPI0025EB5134|nr:ABC transporter substrate-binding protein [uncultured Lamprocystis sp.]